MRRVSRGGVVGELLHQFLGIELVPVLVDESQLDQRHTFLLPNNLLHRITETNDHDSLQCTRDCEILPHLLILDSRIDTGDNSLIPRSQFHVLDCPSSVDSVKAESRIRKNNHCKVSARNPAPGSTILCQLLDHLPFLD